MAFQTAVANNIAFGVIGELFLEGPLRAQPGVLKSASAANNVIGRAFTIAASGDATGSYETSADPKPLEVQAGGTTIFAGILANPKVYANPGVAGDTLAANLTLPNGAIVELVQETAGLIVALPGPFAIGDYVYYTNATGVLSSAAPNVAAPAASTRVPGGRVVRYMSAATGTLAVIAFNDDVKPEAGEAP